MIKIAKARLPKALRAASGVALLLVPPAELHAIDLKIRADDLTHHR